MAKTVRSQPLSQSVVTQTIRAIRSDDKVSSASASKISARPIQSRLPGSCPSLPSSSLSALTAPIRKPDEPPQLEIPATANSQPAPLSHKSTSGPSRSRLSSGSSSFESLNSPPTPNGPSAAAKVAFKHPFKHFDANKAPVKASRQSLSAKAASSASPSSANRMLDDDFFPPHVHVSTTPSVEPKSNHILGPDGQIYTQGDAAKLGLIIRTACEACRNRKLKCSGTLPEIGGCERCNSDAIQCVYSARAPIGRPKKRKVDEGQESTLDVSTFSPVAQAKAKPKPKRNHLASSSVSKPAAKGRAGNLASFNSSAATQDGVPFATYPALQQLQNADYNPMQHSLPMSPAQSEQAHHWNTPQDHSPAAFVPSQSFGSYASPMQKPMVPSSNSIRSRMSSAPKLWSQLQGNFAMTPSDTTTTPCSANSPAYAASSYANDQPPRASESHVSSSSPTAKLPSLDDLSVAAFLQSLDTLEISPAELLQQQQMQMQMQPFSNATSASGTPTASSNYGLGLPFEMISSADSSATNQLTASSVEEWAMRSAILQPGLSFAVPADFSWWDLGINGADLGPGSATASVSATPSSELASMMFPSISAVQPVVADSSNSSGMASRPSGSEHASPVEPSRTQVSERSRRPTFSATQPWPRGADAGMGQGQIQHTVAATETGLGWSTLPVAKPLTNALSGLVEDQANSASPKSSCCSSKSTSTASLSPPDAKHKQLQEPSQEQKASCCSSKSMAPTNTEPQKLNSCCTNKVKDETKETVPERSTSSESAKSCCSNTSMSYAKSATKASSESETPSNEAIEMGPLSTSASVRGAVAPQLDGERKRHAATHAHHPNKVHCVPNPSGKGCTCLCDMSVALLSVKQVLRETDPHKANSRDNADASCSSQRSKNSYATDTIQLTLTASQAITAQCACSADCPTCQSDPSTEISASLLVSTALQIYARAVRILREGFAASSSPTSKAVLGGDSATAATPVHGLFGGLDVTIGTYKPSTSNAKKIALYAIKLELKDLRKALGKISRMAQNFGTMAASTEGKGKRKASMQDGADTKPESIKQQQLLQGMNPIDQLVILKLYRQLTELLKTVEGLEDAA